MKKMKRFLSLLICMVMLMSVLPMSAAAAPITDFEVSFNYNSTPAVEKSIWASIYNIAVSKSSAIGGVGGGYGYPAPSITPANPYNPSETYKENTPYEMVVYARVQKTNVNDVAEKPSASVKGLTAETVEVKAERVGDSGDAMDWVKITIKFKFPCSHNLGNMVSKVEAIHTDEELKAGMEAHFKCSKCGTYFDKDGKPTTEAALIIPKPEHSYTSWENEDPDVHWQVCDYCPHTTTPASHDFGDDLICDDCGFTKTYIIKFNPNDGTVDPASDETDTNGKLASLPVPTHTEKIFVGWFTAAEGGDKVDADTVFTQNTEIFAHWRARNTYAVSYDTNSGTGDFDEQIKTEGISLTLHAAKPERTGYDFTGWKAEDDTVYQPGDPYTANVGTIMTAQWAIKTYTVTYDNNSGTGEFDVQIKEHGKDLQLRAGKPTRNGYEFTGWKADNGTVYQPEDSYAANEGTTLKAQWKAIEYVIVYHPGVGTLPENAPEKYTIEGGVTLPVLTKEGYDFDGWYLDEGFTGEPVADIAENNTGEKHFYAKWTAVVASVTVTPESVKLPAGTVYEDFVATVVAGGNLRKDVKWTIAPAAPAEEGIALLSDEETTIDENTGVLSARKPGKYIVTATSVEDDTKSDTAAVEVLEVYTITYKLDNGTVATANPTTYTVETTDIKLNNPTKAGYTFAGWTGTGLDKATMEVTIAKGSTGNREYTATWIQNVAPVTYFKVTYDANGGTGTMPEVSVEAGKDHTLLANEFKAPAGKTFKCWKIGTKEYKAGEKIDVTENVTVKAVWKNKTASSDLDYVPAAGDNFPTFLWAGLLLFSVVALVEVVVLRRKRS